VKTILLADDSITIQKVVELTFSDGDYRVFCVANGAQALRKIPEVRPDVVLLDIVMPEKNGYEVCEALQADPATASIPVLLLTGTFEPFDQTRAEAAGARGHVTKPFESHTLVQRVEELLAQGAERGRVAAAPVSVASTAIPSPSPASVAASYAASSLAATQASADPAPSFAPAMPRPATQPTGSHPALAPPEPDSGGAYLGFADLAIGEEETVVRDRYDEMDTPASPDTNASGTEPGESMEGFVSGYDMPASTTPPTRGEEPHVRAASVSRPESGFPPAPAATPAAPAGRGDEAIPAASLSPEALDRLADLVVRRMSERVVREIAWEVIPGVAESVVRERIKELEERES
jgi:CheY-like chemotaxis protein